MNIHGWKLHIKILRQKILKLKLEIEELGRSKEDRQIAIINGRLILRHQKVIMQHKRKIALLRRERARRKK
ncbi:MAG: hypothetical protein ACTSQL_01080 [Promethearchaeota archaeon]